MFSPSSTATHFIISLLFLLLPAVHAYQLQHFFFLGPTFTLFSSFSSTSCHYHLSFSFFYFFLLLGPMCTRYLWSLYAHFSINSSSSIPCGSHVHIPCYYIIISFFFVAMFIPATSIKMCNCCILLTLYRFI